MTYKKDTDGLEMCMPEGNGVAKTDTSVLVTDLYLKGEPKGSVAMDVTIGKPSAYYPNKTGPK